MKIKNKIKNLINLITNDLDLKKYYIKKMYEVIKFSKKNYNFITYELLFFFISSCKIIHIKSLVNILSQFNIKIFEKFPENETFFFKSKLNRSFKLKVKNKNQKKYFFKNLFYKNIKKIKKLNNKEINKKFQKIESCFIDTSFFLNRSLNFKIFLLKNKMVFNEFIYNNLLLNFLKKYFITKNFLKDLSLKEKKIFSKNKKKIKIRKIKYIINDDLKEKIKNNFNFYLNFFIKILTEEKNKNKLNKIKIMINDVIFLLNMDFYSLEFIYKKIIKTVKKVNKIKSKIYDIVTNLCDISFLEFNFFFLKNNSNLSWIINLVNLTFSKKIKKNFKNFIKKQSNNIKKIEIDICMSIRSLMKIFLVMKLNKIRVSLIKKKIIASNLHVVNSISRKYYKNDYYLDCIQEGNLALLKLVDTYNYKDEKSFYNYIFFFIKNSISKLLYNSRLVKLPIYAVTLVRLINKVTEDYENKYGEKPNIKYLSKKIKMSEKRLLKIINSVKIPVSTEKIVGEDTVLEELVTDASNIHPEKRILNKELKTCFNKIFKKLDSKYINILFMRYGMNFYKKETLAEIGYRFDLSKERIRQIQNLILNKLRHPQKIKELKKFFTSKNQ